MRQRAESYGVPARRWFMAALLGVASGLLWGCASATAQTEAMPGSEPIFLRERLMAGRAQLTVDPDYAERAFRGLIRRRVGADVTGNTIPGTYVASLYDPASPSEFRIRRAWLFRGDTRVVVPELKVQQGDLLDFALGRLLPVFARGALRPACSLFVEVSDQDGRRLLRHSIPLGAQLESRWVDHRVSLDAAAGHTARVEVGLEGFWCSSDDHALLGDLQLYSRQRPETERPNVLIVWVDKLRADLARPETGIPGHMPFLHELTRRGVLFTNARANSNNTFRSTVQVLTSDPNSEAMAGENFTTPLAAPIGMPTLPNVLAAAGYHTSCLGANIHISRVPDGAARRQVDVGFDRCSIDYRVIEAENDDARITREQVAPWLESGLREPFFVNLHYDGAHEPYPNVDRKNPPESFDTYLKRGQGDPQAALYLYKAELFDEVLKQAYGLLESKGLLERTLVVIASDHGSSLGPDHRSFTFGRFHDLRVTHFGGLYDEQVRTVLLFLNPKLTPGQRHENVELLDLAPTILEFVGLEAPTQFVGRSRLGALRGGAALADRPMFMANELEYMYGVYDPPHKYLHWLEPRERWPIDPGYAPGWDLNKVHDKDHDLFVQQIQRYRRRGMPIGEPRFVSSELFDVSADPREVVDLAAAQPELAGALQARVEKQMLNQRAPEYALDEAREMVAFVSPDLAIYEGTIESDGPLKLSSPLPGCDPWLAQRRDANTLEFRCGAASRPVGLTFYRRAQAELRFSIRRDGVRLGARDFFLGADGLPSPALSAHGEAVVLVPSAQPAVSARTPETVPERDRGVFIYRQLRPGGADEDVGQGELNRAFAAWGYRQ